MSQWTLVRTLLALTDGSHVGMKHALRWNWIHVAEAGAGAQLVLCHVIQV